MKKIFKKRELKRSEKKILYSMLISLILLAVVIAIHVPPVWVRLGPDNYISIGNNEWIACGGAEEPLTEGRYFKITQSSWLEGEPACKYEVDPVGFPVSCCYIDGEGIYGISIMDFIFDFCIITLGVAIIIFYFDKISKKGVKK